MSPTPLAGTVILDTTRFISGPMATQMLGDLGATIIKVEQPGTGDDTRLIAPLDDGISHFFASYNRNKRSVVLDLRTEPGRSAFLRLAAAADAVVENFRPGVADRLGIGYDAVRAVNDDAVYCSISGFGLDGPLSDRIAFDIVAQAMTGVMHLNGRPGDAPLKLGLPVGDLAAAQDAARAILAGLVSRSTTGRGAFLQVSLFDSLLALTSYYAGRLFATGEVPPAVGNDHHSSVPYGVFPTSDGAAVIAAYNDRFWIRLAGALELDDLVDDPRFTTATARHTHRDDCNAAVAARTATMTTDELVALLLRRDVPCAPVLDLRQALTQEHARLRGTVIGHDGAGPRGIAPAIRVDGARSPVHRPPALGEHTESVLREMAGLDDAEIAAVVAAAENGGGR